MLQQIRSRLDVAIAANDAPVQTEQLGIADQAGPGQRVRRLPEACSARNDHARRRPMGLAGARNRRRARRHQRDARLSPEH